jgi:hypothetical protein
MGRCLPAGRGSQTHNQGRHQERPQERQERGLASAGHPTNSPRHCEGTFTTWSVWEAWQEDLHRYLRADWSKADAKTVKGLQAVASLIRREQDAIRKVLSEPHHPMTTGRTEDYLDDIQRALGDRRRTFRNLNRLNDLLTLIHLHLTDRADEREWARILRENHLRHDGKPPPRRLVDGKGLLL